MPQHKSAVKRVRQNEKHRQRNKTKRSKMKTLIKNVFENDDKEQAEKDFKKASAYLDKLSTKGFVHKNFAARKKSRMAQHVNNL